MRNNVIVLATDMAGGMGVVETNSLPWPHNKEDLQSFKRITAGQDLVMGSATFESMDQLVDWSDRTPYVVTTNESSTLPSYAVRVSPIDLSALLNREKPLFIIGGPTLFNYNPADLWGTVETVYHSLLLSTYDCDLYLHPTALSYMENEFRNVETTKLNNYTVLNKRTR